MNSSACETFPVLRPEIAGVPVRELAHQFGTPCFVYDAAAIQSRIEDLRAFDVIRYAQKACSNIAILDLIRRHGVLVDAVSAGELQRSFAAGYSATGDPPPVVYTADIFDEEALELAVKSGMHVNVGSPDMIAQLGERAPAARSRCESTRASATAIATRPTPAATTRNTASGTPSLPK